MKILGLFMLAYGASWVGYIWATPDVQLIPSIIGGLLVGLGAWIASRG